MISLETRGHGGAGRAAGRAHLRAGGNGNLGQRREAALPVCDEGMSSREVMIRAAQDESAPSGRKQTRVA